jgi:hypothetical protein
MTRIFENTEKGDLVDLVDPVLTIDQYRSKMGEDSDIVVITYRVRDQEPALDLVNFFEKGYPFVLDADVSSGPVDELDYLVFVELVREPEVADQIMKITTELCNLTDQDIQDWRFSFRSQLRKHDLSAAEIQNVVPLTPEDYLERSAESDGKFLEAIKTAAGLPVDASGTDSEFSKKLKLAAGIRI